MRWIATASRRATHTYWKGFKRGTAVGLVARTRGAGDVAMFIGHYALAFGAKKAGAEVSLGTLFLACQFADLLWPTFLLLGLERVEIDPGNTLVTPLNFVSYPVLAQPRDAAGVVGAVRAAVSRRCAAGHAVAIVTVGALVFSHYVLDVITHRPDMPITIGGSRRLGFGLWNYPGTTLAIESAMFIIGATIYSGVTRERDRTGRIGLWALIATLVAIYFASLYGPPPPNTAAIAIAGHLLWLFVIWAYWIDRHRTARHRP